jgi:predicted nucleic acid-binding protein
MAAATVVADTSVLINFLRIDRMDLLGRHPCRFLATDHVEAEIEDDEQRARYMAAIAAGHLETCTVTDSEEVALYMRLGPGQRLGSGECSAIAVALRRHHAIAIDDNKAVNRALREAGLKSAWARHHRFRIKAASFRDLL